MGKINFKIEDVLEDFIVGIGIEVGKEGVTFEVEQVN